eukprot:2337619-Pleurochrysis_carterae.AAC.1
MDDNSPASEKIRSRARARRPRRQAWRGFASWLPRYSCAEPSPCTTTCKLTQEIMQSAHAPGSSRVVSFALTFSASTSAIAPFCPQLSPKR